MKTIEEHYQGYLKSFRKESLELLVERFNGEVGNYGWVGVRGAFLRALIETLEARGVDLTNITTQYDDLNTKGHSFKYKVKLALIQIEN